MTVVADTSPLNYVTWIGHAHLFPALYGRILVPPAVWDELQHAGTPLQVRALLAGPPEWLIVTAAPTPLTAACLDSLHRGEAEALGLAVSCSADFVLVDDLRARQCAVAHGLKVAGTLRVLADAALRGYIDLAVAFQRLQQTTFRASTLLYQKLLAEITGPKP